jgi:hypothetical protein
MTKIDAGGRHSGGGGARVVRSGDGSRCPGTEDVWVSSHVKEKKGERDRGKPPTTRSLRGREWRGGRILRAAARVRGREMQGCTSEGKGCARIRARAL